jgi:acyl-CoA dehydrogenase
MTTASVESSFAAAVREIASGPAAADSDLVDQQGCFPQRSIDALKEAKGLSAFVPEVYGGAGIGFLEIARACFELSRECASTGMIFAMHQIQVGCLVRHGLGTDFFDDYVWELAKTQALIASVTSEVGVGGDLRKSIAAVAPDGADLVLEKSAPTVSYGEHADALLITCRRAQDAEPADQVLVLARRDETSLTPAGSWDALGMRGTCSPGYSVQARVPSNQVLSAPFGEVAERTMVPFSHILWAHVWLGIATAAYDRARVFVREQAQRAPQVMPSTAVRLSAAATELYAMRAEVDAAASEYAELLEADPADDDGFTMGYAIRLNTLKISASERVQRICLSALGICGMAGYKNDSRFGVGRHIRDALSAPLMIANDRIHSTNAGLLLVNKVL